jgi:hypothetical protein
MNWDCSYMSSSINTMLRFNVLVHKARVLHYFCFFASGYIWVSQNANTPVLNFNTIYKKHIWKLLLKIQLFFNHLSQQFSPNILPFCNVSLLTEGLFSVSYLHLFLQRSNKRQSNSTRPGLQERWVMTGQIFLCPCWCIYVRLKLSCKSNISDISMWKVCQIRFINLLMYPHSYLSSMQFLKVTSSLESHHPHI